jgi:NAD(P)H-dependent flavin oxidoreductase YrpB (nitropropane dioxygenase family)
MRTRFIATKEAPVHEKVKQAIVDTTERDTRLVMRPLRNIQQMFFNAGVERLLETERQKGASLQISDNFDQVAGVYLRVMVQGDMDAGAWSCGMVAG